MTAAGKGSAPRPFSVPRDEFEKRWDEIFENNKQNEIDNTDSSKNYYQDILSTEDCFSFDD
jgi:hypothetical protein